MRQFCEESNEALVWLLYRFVGYRASMQFLFVMCLFSVSMSLIPLKATLYLTSLNSGFVLGLEGAYYVIIVRHLSQRSQLHSLPECAKLQPPSSAVSILFIIFTTIETTSESLGDTLLECREIFYSLLSKISRPAVYRLLIST